MAKPKVSRSPLRLATLLLSLPLAFAANARSLFDQGDGGSRVGQGALSLGLHSSKGEGTFSDSGQVFAAGDVDTRAAVLGLSYRFAERWTIEGSLPYVRRRNSGFLSHNPALLRPQQPGLPTVDDGDWHGGTQDASLTLRWDAIDDALLLRPFVRISIPTRNYPFFGNSAIGTRLHKGQLGVELVRPFGLSDFYWRAQYAYEVIERSYEQVNTNAHLIELEVGWYATDRLRLRSFVTDRDGNGLRGNVDYAGRSNLRWFHHDQNVRHSATVAGLGVEYALSERWSASAVALKLVDGAAIHRITFASTFEIAWHFGAGRSH